MDTNNESTNPEQGMDVASAAAAIAGLMGPDPSDNPQGRDDDNSANDLADQAARDLAEHEEQEADESDVEATNDEDAESDEGEENAEDDAGQDEPRYTVKVDGKDVEVTQSELLAGYSRQADYTRKTQQLAELRTTQETELQSVRQEREQYVHLLGILEEQVKAATPADVDWNKRFDEDPIAAAKEHALWQQNQARLNAIQNERAQVQAQQQADQEASLRATLKAESEALVAAVPAWKDPKKASEEHAAIRTYAVDKLGFKPQEIAAITDHRAVITLRKAWLYDQAQARAQNLKPATPKPSAVAKPGSAGAPRKQTDITRAQKRLEKTGSVKDAAGLISKLL